MAQTKFIFITGGVVSSIGKGLTSACIGALLKAKNITIDSSEPFSVQSDGENYKTNHLDIHIKEKGLLLKVPYSL